MPRDKIFEAQQRLIKVEKAMDKANQGVETFFQMLNDELVVMGR